MSDSRSLREFAEAYTKAWCSRDPGRVAAHFAPDGSLTINGGAPSRGRAAITEAAAGFMAAFPDLQVILDRLEPHETGVRYHWTLVGTYAATGNPVRISGHEDWTLDADGRIAASLGSFDAQDYERQVEGRA